MDIITDEHPPLMDNTPPCSGSMEEEAKLPMDPTESAPENTEVTETKKGGPRGRGRGRGPRRYSRGQMRKRALNGYAYTRRGMGRMRPYPDARGRTGTRGRGMPFYPPAPPMRGVMKAPFLPPPPRYRLPFSPLPPLPPESMAFRSRPPPFQARGMGPLPQGHFPPPLGFPNGPGAPAPPPPGRGQRWPGPPGGRHY